MSLCDIPEEMSAGFRKVNIDTKVGGPILEGRTGESPRTNFRQAVAGNCTVRGAVLDSLSLVQYHDVEFLLIVEHVNI